MWGFLGRVFSGLWRWLDAVRRTVVNLLFLLLIGIIVALVLGPPAPTVPDGAALVLRPTGSLVEEAELDDPFSLLRAGAAPGSQTLLRDLLEAIHAARTDARISALVIETDALGGASLSKLAELRTAIATFRDTGKPVVARGERFTQAQYYLATAADDIQLAPDGFLLLRGLARYVSYFKGALDTLGVKVHVFRVGEYKSFSEPFTRADMSPEDRDASRDLLDGLWDVMREDIAARRGIAVTELDRYVDDYRGALAAAGGDPAQAAKDAKLVDRFSTRDEWRDALIGKFGKSDDGKSFKQIRVPTYLAAVRDARATTGQRVAVLVAQGSILDGAQPPGSVGGDTLARRIREVRDDERVKALVLRIDSPGGSAWASEVVRRELELTRAAGKPVVASMSSVAASGGYWIAAGADEIWAAPTTLTGSIGIFALFPEFAAPLERVGVTVDGVATGPLAGAFDPRRPLDPAAAGALQLGIEHGYRRFLDTVAKARGMRVEEVELVARGRVWTGTAAEKLGLVDALGGLDDAVAAAARRAGLDRYDVVWPEADLPFASRVLRRLDKVLGQTLLPTAEAPAGGLGALLDTVRAGAAALRQWNDPRHLYTHCLCDAP